MKGWLVMDTPCHGIKNVTFVHYLFHNIAAALFNNAAAIL